MEQSRRAFLRTIATIAAAIPIFRADAAVRWASRTGTVIPAMLVHQEALAESRMFAAMWPQRTRQLDLGTDISQALFGSAAVDWARLPAPVVGLTTPETLFCLEQVAAACGVRTVARISTSEAGTPAIAIERLSAFLSMDSPWRPQEPVLNTAPDRWVAWLMAPRTALQLNP